MSIVIYLVVFSVALMFAALSFAGLESKNH